jgi:hypothetical protein
VSFVGPSFPAAKMTAMFRSYAIFEAIVIGLSGSNAAELP